MVGFLIGLGFGIAVTLVVIGCFAIESNEDAYSIGYNNGFIAGADITAEKQIAEGVCA